ncbi:MULTISPECIES: macro domain-containing protein [Burkholderia cepacia complex]|nr:MULTISPECIES: macro domain-containing protein [Burkholderia cepacia complex]MBJ9963664.1 macro domain-containing protein [Burkholderia seminalis]
MNNHTIQIQFVSPHTSFLNVISAAPHPEITTRVGLLPFGMKCDAIVASANSYGWMGGGLDLVYRNEFGFELQWTAQRFITDKYADGYIPVGECLSVPTNSPTIPNVIFAPTMKQPNPIADPCILENVYLSIFRTACHHGYKNIGIPDLGTGIGRVPPETSARFAISAFKSFKEQQ